MAFSSTRFLIFLVVVLCVLSIPGGADRKKRLLALGSCFFYAAWDYRYLALLLGISVIDYWCAARIVETEQPTRRRFWLVLSVVSNLAILGYFKYYNFFISNLNGIIGASGHAIPYTKILLPAGISFYTFKSMSYTIDVYRRHIEPCRSQIDYTTFITFFPELIAGPIVRASVFLPQMSREIGPTRKRLASGVSLFLLGLTKKLVIADHLGSMVRPIFAAPEQYSGVSIWLGTIAYSIQIYCDFAGYSDMAIGTAMMIGYDLPENFNMPYLSSNVTEFWRRWHITLSSWLRDYLYIPLGGNRRGSIRTYLNLFITMLLGGLWHGASWNFVLWGGLHGCGLALHRLYGRVSGKRSFIPAWLGVVATYLFVSLCWVPFRSPSLTTTWLMLRKMFLFSHDGALWYPSLGWAVGLIVAGHILGSYLAAASLRDSSRGESLLARLFGAHLERNPISGWHIRLSVDSVQGSFVACTWALCVFYFAATDFNPFIYFQF